MIDVRRASTVPPVYCENKSPHISIFDSYIMEFSVTESEGGTYYYVIGSGHPNPTVYDQGCMASLSGSFTWGKRGRTLGLKMVGSVVLSDVAWST